MFWLEMVDEEKDKFYYIRVHKSSQKFLLELDSYLLGVVVCDYCL